MQDKGIVNDKVKSILAAGSKIFSQRSFHEVKMQEIADLAGVGKGTIYEYFSSKEELLSQVLKLGVNQYREEINFRNIEGKDIWDRMEKYLNANIEFFWNNREMGNLLVHSDHPFQKRIKEWLLDVRQDSLRDLEDVFSEAVSRGEIRDVSPSLAAKIFRSIISEVIPGTILLEGEKPDEKDINEIVVILREGLKDSS